MKVNELRIGNLVHHNIENSKSDFLGNELIVFELDEKIITTYYVDHLNSKVIVRNKQNYYPIPLTEKWLIKAGFSVKEYKAGYIGKDFTSGQMTLSFVLCNPFAKGDWNDCYTFDLRDSMFKSLRYVHELQNLYFSLTNSELQFVS